MNNKRGQEMSTNTIILIVLGVIVLVVLALGFTMGWEKVFPFLSSNNVDNVKTVCSQACSTNSAYDYCYTLRTLNDPDTKTSVKGSCNFLANFEIPAVATSETLSGLDLKRYGLATCPSINCETSKPKCGDISLKIDGKTYSGREMNSSKCDQSVDSSNKPIVKDKLYPTPLSNVGVANSNLPQVCCLVAA